MKFRRMFFPAKEPPVPEAPPEPEFMQVRVEHDPIVPTPTMREFAKQILENPAWENACRYLREEQLRSFVATNQNDAARREHIYKTLVAIDDVTIQLDLLANPVTLTAKPRRLTQPK